MLNATVLNGTVIKFADTVARFNVDADTGIGSLYKINGEYLANVSDINKEGMHWYCYIFGKRCSGIIPTQFLNQQ